MNQPPAYVPFFHPMPVWDYWPLLVIPLAMGVAVVYKSIKCQHMRQVPREAFVITLYILLGMVAAGALLWALDRVRELMV